MFLTFQDIAGLRRVYLNINDVSLNSGGLLEYTAPGAIVGPTYQCILGEEFKRARVGDRFFYENCESNSFNNGEFIIIIDRQLRKYFMFSMAIFWCLYHRIYKAPNYIGTFTRSTFSAKKQNKNGKPRDT